MAQQDLTLGTVADDGNGEFAHTAFPKVQANFDELYAAIAGVTNGTDGADGATGATGPAGADGADGDSAYQIAVDAGFVGDEAAWLASLVGETGATGASGSGSGDMLAANNLSELPNAATARTNLGLGTLATLGAVPDASITLAKQSNLAANSIIGNNTGSAATPIALTATQVNSLLGVDTIAENVTALSSSLDATDLAILDLATKAEVSAVVDKTGSAYTILTTDFGKTIEVDDAVTLPVLTSASVRKRIDMINLGTEVTLTLDTNVTLAANSATLIEAGAAASMYLTSSDGTNAVWRVIGGRA